MKKLLFAVAVCASMMAFSQDAASCATKCSDAPAAVKNAKADKAAKRLAMNAKKCGMSVEDFSKLSKAEQKAKINEANLKMNAKKCGMSVEDFSKLSKDEQKAKLADAKAARAAAKAKRAKKSKKAE